LPVLDQLLDLTEQEAINGAQVIIIVLIFENRQTEHVRLE